MYNQGISKSGDILDNAVNEGIVDKRGAFYSYGEQRLAQGRENAKTFLVANPELMLTIEDKVRESKGLPMFAMPIPEAPDKAKANGAKRKQKSVSKDAEQGSFAAAS